MYSNSYLVGKAATALYLRHKKKKQAQTIDTEKLQNIILELEPQ